MRTVVEIEWDQPDEEQWLCPDNILYCLQKECKNTNFEVREVNVIDYDEYKKEVLNKIERLRIKSELRK